MCYGLAVTALIALAGCRTAPPPAHPLRWARAWINAFNSRQLTYFDPLLTSQATYEDASSGGPRSGAALGLLLGSRWNYMPELRFELERATGDKNTVKVEFTATYMTVPPGPPRRGEFIIELQDNLIVRARGYWFASVPPWRGGTMRPQL